MQGRSQIYKVGGGGGGGVGGAVRYVRLSIALF